MAPSGEKPKRQFAGNSLSQKKREAFMKVFELAKKLEVKSVFLMDKIKRQWRLPVKSHMDSLTPEMAERIERKFYSAQKKRTDKPPSRKKQIRKKNTASAPAKTSEKTKASSVKKTAEKKTKTKALSKKTKSAGGKRRSPSSKTVKKAKTAGKSAAHSRRPSASIEKAGQAETQSDKAQSQGAPPVKRRMIIRRRAEETAIRPSKIPRPSNTKASEKTEPEKSAAPSSVKTKNIRLDLVSVQSEDLLTEDFNDKNQEAGKAKKQPKKASAEKDGSSKFHATDFRKREMIFQPRKKRLLSAGGKKTKITTPKSHKRIVKVYGEMSFENLCKTMGLKKHLVAQKLKEEGIDIKEKPILDFESIALTVPSFGYTAKNTKHTAKEILDQMGSSKEGGKLSEEKAKPPVVTVMGHVDHGKTTLLDSIRKADTAKTEAGGITQHIGAYTVPIGDSFITFIDTPGHSAFTAMRSRGAGVTDVAVIVVSAVDGVMPQTVEALNHARSAKIPLIIAVNKMDAPGADMEKVKKQMSEQNVLSEDWGGDTGFIPLSALKSEGIKELLEHIRLVAEIQELKCRPIGPANGTVLEARKEKGLGAVVSLLLKDGSLKTGDFALAGACKGRIRQIKDDQGRLIRSAGPGRPVEVIGFEDLPLAGAPFYTVKDEKSAKSLWAVIKSKSDETQTEEKTDLSPEELLAQMEQDAQKTELNLVLKTDVRGSLEAVQSALQNIKSNELELKIVHAGAGAVTESDVLLAGAVKAAVVAFNVRPGPKALKVAKEKEVKIYTHSVIYDLLDQVKKLMLGLLKAETVEEELGRAETREIFPLSKKGIVAGCYVTEGQIPRNALIRLIRDGHLIHKGTIAGLRRFKEDVQKVTSGMECGISLEKFNDIKPKDILEAYIQKERPRTEL